jgi:hypothetical protein
LFQEIFTRWKFFPPNSFKLYVIYLYLLNIGRHPFFKYRCKSSKGSLFYLRILYTQKGTIMTSENCRDTRKPTPFWCPYEWSINNHIIIVQYCLCVVVFLLPCLHDVIPRSPHRYSATVRYLAITSILWCLGTWIIIIHPQRLFSLLAKLTHSTYRNRVPQCISPRRNWVSFSDSHPLSR